VAKVALRFGCAKQPKNLEWCLLDNAFLQKTDGSSVFSFFSFFLEREELERKKEEKALTNYY
jgi:hypothetical protein